MSVIVRSPPELGSVPMILCKGADSSMLDPSVCEGQENIIDDGEKFNGEAGLQNDGDKWRASTMLGIQAHLGQFASEGLRTLVLGVRILTEQELTDWLAQYNAAASSISNRSASLKKAAFDIEKQLHIVGATAIEDKLQVRVPETIENIRNAGIKLWVLTGDKRETAIEIGYSTKVLHPKMYLTDVAEGDDQVVKTIIAMEFMRLVKSGKLAQYQTSSCSVTKKRSLFKSLFDFSKCLGHLLKVSSRAFRRFWHQYIKTCFGACNKGRSEVALELIDREEERERIFGDPVMRCRKVREVAENIIREYMQSPAGLQERASRLVQIHEDPDKNHEELETSLLNRSSSVPSVFSRARSAQSAMDLNNGHVTQAAMRSISLASTTSNDPHIVDEDTLSLQSFVPGSDGNITSSFNKKKRSIMEKLFAVDPDVRKGRLKRHTFKDKRSKPSSEAPDILLDADRGLVIEGGALAHFLGDTFLEEILFSVASNCQSVIACRVSPKQKALLVKLVRSFVNPTPITLAIGDGANDVGMIQEAHVGVGISGLEGQQAVNASDFAIAQFRFLEDLLLIHGRWNFIRLSKVILFSFYKNALLVGTLLVFSPRTLYSGTPLYDNWVYSGFNFVCGFPILLLGMFDRDLEPSYVKQHPELYSSGPNNEHLSLRVFLRWVILCVCHSLLISYLCMYSLIIGGGMSSAFKGLMARLDMPGEGEGGDLKVYGTTVFTALVWVLAIKVGLSTLFHISNNHIEAELEFTLPFHL
jgi:magnesium-transporting ATPase (P-type)